MSWSWIPENPPVWDPAKAAVIGAAPPGVFHFEKAMPGDLLPGSWWRVEDEGRVLGYGWMDHGWGDAEVLLAVAPAARGSGVGTFILDRLEDEARAQGINYIYNVVPTVHPDREGLSRWLEARRFRGDSGEGLLKRAVPGVRSRA